jgi:type IV secretory pathway VirB4 component
MLFKEFRDLTRKPEQLRGLHDLLNYAYPLDDYTIVQKDGALLCAFECAGLDLNSASVEELDAHRLQANRALTRLDDGFQYHFDLVRSLSVDYPTRQFPDAVSAALDREREIQYSTEGQHLETRCIMTITYRPPGDNETRVTRLLFTGKHDRSDRRRLVKWFKQKLRECEDAIGPVWKLTALGL